MFSKVALFITAAFAASAMAGQCKSGPAQCCNSLEKPTSEAASRQLALLGVTVKNLTGQVGFQCDPVTAAAARTGSSCTSQLVCCEKKFGKQHVGINCTPADVELD